MFSNLNLGSLLSTVTLFQLVAGFSYTSHSYLGGVLEDYLTDNSPKTLESIRNNIPVSYTHLTLPTNREV